MKSKRTLLFRAGTILVLLLIAGLMFIIGRGHTVYFDSKSAEYNGTSVEPPYKLEIYVNDERVAKLYDGERGMSPWIGQNFKMKVEVTKEKGGKSVTQSVSMKLPYNMDGIILNVPALLAGLPEEAYLSEFVATQAEPAEEEEVMTDEFGISADPEEGTEDSAAEMPEP